MTEKELLLSRLTDKKRNASENSMITSTFFLSIDEKSDIIPLDRCITDVKTFYYGGYEDAERTIAVFVPAYFEIQNIDNFYKENNSDNPLSLLLIKKDRFSALSHRDYLGAVMGLGIKREMLGDILVTEDGCYMFCLNTVSGYICKNLKKAGRGTLICEEIPISTFVKNQESADEIFLSLASLRLDNIVSASFNISRTLATQAISKGIIFVNSSRAEKSDSVVKQGDKVVMRGKGKIILSEIIGLNKKGRTHIKILKYK